MDAIRINTQQNQNAIQQQRVQQQQQQQDGWTPCEPSGGVFTKTPASCGG
jgi:hypothetical protein